MTTKKKQFHRQTNTINLSLQFINNHDLYSKGYCYAFLISMAYPGALNSLYAVAVWFASYALVAVIGLLQISCFVGISIFNP
ncbi:hypothetical protein QVD17_00494 [Tagetes erecta]|uniref:Uncharacterized protein n=1 Tax=Tagetes erecta TaxID=13708 RepID=A0AAD8L3B7_TARER|nr:hypothetical protein QVD17_00494 [Tagetes erecta]